MLYYRDHVTRPAILQSGTSIFYCYAMYVVTAAHGYLRLIPNQLWLITCTVSTLLAACYHQAEHTWRLFMLYMQYTMHIIVYMYVTIQLCACAHVACSMILMNI